MTVPDGDWNIGYLVPQPGTYKHSLGSMEKISLAGISNTWHPQKIDWTALNELDYDEEDEDELRSAGRMLCRVYKNHFGYEKVIVSYEWNQEDVYGANRETDIYALIDSHQIAPKFLAHVTEHSCGNNDANSERVVGLMVEKVANTRRATLEDLQACKDALARLHALGIAFGYLGPEHFLIANNNEHGSTRALLQPLSGCYQTSDRNIFAAEIDSLEPMFEQAAAQPEQEEGGFSLSIELSEEICAINLRDNGLHPRVLEQAREGRITITEEDHVELLAEFKREQEEHRARIIKERKSKPEGQT